MDPAPADVLVARAVRAHTQALLIMTVAVLLLALIGVGALSFAGQDRSTAPITAGLTLLGVGQLAALAGAAIAGYGLVQLLRSIGEPGSTHSAAAAVSQIPSAELRATASRLALLMRIVLGACVLVIATWAIADPTGLLGAAIGAVLALQVLVAIALVRVQLLRRVSSTH